MKTQKQLIEEINEVTIELRVVLLGVPNTEDKGMAGDIKELKNQLLRQNGRIRKNTLGLIGLGSFLVGLGVLEWTDIISLFG